MSAPPCVQSAARDDAALYRRHADGLLRGLRAHFPGASAEDIEDACATTWAQFVRYQPERRNVGAWLRVTARHSMLKLIRTHSRHPTTSVEVCGDDWQEFTGGRPDEVEARVYARDVMRRVRSLDGGRREVVALSSAGLAPHEIATELGLSTRQVRKRITRGRRDLREEIAA